MKIKNISLQTRTKREDLRIQLKSYKKLSSNFNINININVNILLIETIEVH